jgi:CheY-like chemotaxis protein
MAFGRKHRLCEILDFARAVWDQLRLSERVVLQWQWCRADSAQVGRDGCASDLHHLPVEGDGMSTPLPARVLVVDPYLEGSESLALLLQLCGYEVQYLRDGRSVLAACRVLRPTALIMELRLPGLDGWQVAQQIRQDEDLRDMLLIAFTACGDEQDSIRSREAGIDYHLLKPGDLDLLLALLACQPACSAWLP